MAEMDLATATIGIEVDLSEMQDGFDAAEKQAEAAGDQAGSAFSTALQASVLAGATAVVGAIAGIGAAVWDMASSTQAATNQFQAALGLSREEAEALGDVALEVFGNNFGGSLDDVSASILTIKQQMRGLADEELASVAENALSVRDVFGIEVADSTAAANVLMEQFGLSSDEAFDFIVAGNQRGLNASGDFLETINEYSVQFASGGATADQFFSLMESGFVNGVLGTDKAADAFKEFNIRIQDGSTTTAESLSALGINTEELFAKMSAGELTSADAFQTVMDGLRGIEDPLLRNQIAVGLLGTQWEDLGPEVASGLTLAGTSMADLAGSTDSLSAKYNDLGSMFRGTWRQIQVDVLAPIGDKLMEIANAILPHVQAGLQALGALLSGDLSLGQFVAQIGSWISGALPAIQTGLASILNAMVGWIAGALPGWITSLGAFAAAAVQWVVDALPGLLAHLAQVQQALIGWVMGALPSWAASLIELGGKLLSWVLDALPGLITNLGQVLTDMLAWVLDSIPGWASNLAELGAQLVQWVIDALPGLGEQLGEVLGSILSWLGSTIATVVPKLAELGATFISWIVTEVLPALPGKLLEIGSALLGFLGNLLAEVLPIIADLASSFMDWVTEDVLPALPGLLGQIWGAISSWISDTASKAWEAAKQIGANIADGISGMIRDGLNGLHNFVASIINPIIEGINTVIDGLNLVNPLEDIPRLSYIAQLASGTNFWGGGPAIVSERGLEWGNLPGIGSGLLMPGAYNLPRGSSVLDANTTAQMFTGNAGNTITQNFEAGIDSAQVRALARQGVEEALSAVGRNAYIRQQTKRK